MVWIARKIRTDEDIDSEGRIRRKKKGRDTSEILKEGGDRANDIINKMGGI